MTLCSGKFATQALSHEVGHETKCGKEIGIVDALQEPIEDVVASASVRLDVLDGGVVWSLAGKSHPLSC